MEPLVVRSTQTALAHHIPANLHAQVQAYAHDYCHGDLAVALMRLHDSHLLDHHLIRAISHHAEHVRPAFFQTWMEATPEWQAGASAALTNDHLPKIANLFVTAADHARFITPDAAGELAALTLRWFFPRKMITGMLRVRLAYSVCSANTITTADEYVRFVDTLATDLTGDGSRATIPVVGRQTACEAVVKPHNGGLHIRVDSWSSPEFYMELMLPANIIDRLINGQNKNLLTDL